ncbi:Aspartic protease 6, partial [Toxocara canis]
SKTFTNLTKPFKAIYGSGYSNGYFASDVLNFSNFSIPAQEFGVATSLAPVFGMQPIDGIMGLGWPSLTKNNARPPMQNLLGQLDEPIFTVWMDSTPRLSQGGVGGLITYGGFDSTNCAPDVNWIPLSSMSYWQFPIQGFAIGQLSINIEQQAISDTGTSWIGGPSYYINLILSQIGAVYNPYFRMNTISCIQRFTSPELIFFIGNRRYTIASSDYIFDVQLGGGLCGVALFAMNGKGKIPAWSLGDIFIRKYCNVYDIGGKRIGFSLAKHSLRESF